MIVKGHCGLIEVANWNWHSCLVRICQILDISYYPTFGSFWPWFPWQYKPNLVKKYVQYIMVDFMYYCLHDFLLVSLVNFSVQWYLKLLHHHRKQKNISFTNCMLVVFTIEGARNRIKWRQIIPFKNTTQLRKYYQNWEISFYYELSFSVLMIS